MSLVYHIDWGTRCQSNLRMIDQGIDKAIVQAQDNDSQ